MGVTLSAAKFIGLVSKLVGQTVLNLLDGFRRITGLNRTKRLFLPYLSGERTTPHNDQLSEWNMWGWELRQMLEAMTLAVLEACVSLLDCQKRAGQRRACCR